MSRRCENLGYLVHPGTSMGVQTGYAAHTASGIKTAGFVTRLYRGTGEADIQCQPKRHKRKPREAESRNANVCGRWDRSSDEASVMGVEQRIPRDMCVIERQLGRG
jgi:hypothetical protein